MQHMLPITLALSATALALAAGGAVAAPGGMGGGMGGGMSGGSGGSGGGHGMSTPPSTSGDASRLRDSPSSGLKEGMTVKDSSGADVGKITKVGQSGGQSAALVEVGGKTVVLMGSTLKVSGDSATSTQTKAEIEAAPQPKSS